MLSIEAGLVLALAAFWTIDGLTFLPVWIQMLAVGFVTLAVASDFLAWPSRERAIRDSYLVLKKNDFVLEYAGKPTAISKSSVSIHEVVMQAGGVKKIVLSLPYGRICLDDYENMEELHESLKRFLHVDTPKKG